MSIIDLTVHELQEKLKNKELTITEITKAYVDRINEKEKEVEAFVKNTVANSYSSRNFNKDGVLKNSKDIEKWHYRRKSNLHSASWHVPYPCCYNITCKCYRHGIICNFCFDFFS